MYGGYPLCCPWCPDFPQILLCGNLTSLNNCSSFCPSSRNYCLPQNHLIFYASVAGIGTPNLRKHWCRWGDSHSQETTFEVVMSALHHNGVYGTRGGSRTHKRIVLSDPGMPIPFTLALMEPVVGLAPTVSCLRNRRIAIYS